MNLTLKIALFSCAGFAVLGTSGCKVGECTENLPDGGTTKKENCVQLEPTIEYRDARVRSASRPWTPGHSVSISNRNGPLKVALGNAADPTVQFSGIPFTRETDNAEGAEKAKNRLGAMADPAFAAGDNVNLAAPGGGFDGYDLTVWIPPNFDSSITLVNDNGTTTLYGADGTTTTTVTSHSIVATNLSRAINLHAEVGDIDFGGAPAGAGNVVRTDLGNVIARIGATNLSITAKTDSGGPVAFPATWSTNVAEDKLSGAATLGDGSGTLSVTSGGGSISFYAQ